MNREINFFDAAVSYFKEDKLFKNIKHKELLMSIADDIEKLRNIDVDFSSISNAIKKEYNIDIKPNSISAFMRKYKVYKSNKIPTTKSQATKKTVKTKE